MRRDLLIKCILHEGLNLQKKPSIDLSNTEINKTTFEYKGNQYRLTGYYYIYKLSNGETKHAAVHKEDANAIAGYGVSGVIVDPRKVKFLDRISKYADNVEVQASDLAFNERMIKDGRKFFVFLKSLPPQLSPEKYGKAAVKWAMNSMDLRTDEEPMNEGLNLAKKQQVPLSQAKKGDRVYCKYYYTPEECVKYDLQRIHTPGQYYDVLHVEGDTIIIDTNPSGTHHHRIHPSNNIWPGGYTVDDFFALYKNPSKINEGLNLPKKQTSPLNTAEVGDELLCKKPCGIYFTVGTKYIIKNVDGTQIEVIDDMKQYHTMQTDGSKGWPGNHSTGDYFDLYKKTQSINEELTNDSIPKIIRKLGKEYREENKCTLWQINNGRCENFAMDILKALGGYGPQTYELTTDNFFNIRGNEGESAAFKDESGKYYYQNYGTLPDDINPDDFFDVGDHVWIYHQGKHYDAEEPNGVANFLDLPIFKRAINRYRHNQSKLSEGLNLPKKAKTIINSWLSAIPTQTKPTAYEIIVDNLLEDLRERAYNFTQEIGTAEYIVDINWDNINYVDSNNIMDWVSLRLDNQDPEHLSGIEFETLGNILSGYLRTFDCFHGVDWVITYDGDDNYITMNVEFVQDPPVYQIDVLTEGLNLVKKELTPDERLIRDYIGQYDVYQFNMFPNRDFYFKDNKNGFIVDIKVGGVYMSDDVTDDLQQQLQHLTYDGILSVVQKAFNSIYNNKIDEVVTDSTEFDLENMKQSESEFNRNQVNEGLNLPKKKPSVQNAPVGTILRCKEYYNDEDWAKVSSFRQKRYFTPNKFYNVVGRSDADNSITISTNVNNSTLTFPDHWEWNGWTIDRMFERTDQMVKEQLNLPKSYLEETSIIRDGKTSLVKLAGPVGWFEKNQYRYGTVQKLYRSLNENVIAVVKPDDNSQDEPKEMMITELHCGVVGV